MRIIQNRNQNPQILNFAVSGVEYNPKTRNERRHACMSRGNMDFSTLSPGDAVSNGCYLIGAGI